MLVVKNTLLQLGSGIYLLGSPCMVVVMLFHIGGSKIFYAIFLSIFLLPLFIPFFLGIFLINISKKVNVK